MTKSAQALVCFLVEWYQGGPIGLSADDAAVHLLRAASASERLGEPVDLVLVLTMPADSTLFAVFTSADVEAVIHACQRAGWPADRITADVQPWLPAGNPCDGAAVR
ncbi:hypothetical protein [Mycobacterium asiaticum]|uniref:DUF3303 domain-containing protein n=1 Tax=Mycobacterium asiaticum TaxID=1790 RepID=A0A1A3NK69_MYCAS|nr:hypothetical protein [Mycobacterium asiaticum]OBK21449.1 hypothetical protein A5635_23410 [Mycobacterium asiaticum]